MPLKDFVEKTKQGIVFKRAREQPLAVLPLVLVALLIVFFWRVLWQAVVVLALVALVILSVLKLLYGEPMLKELTARKRTLLSEIDILEKNYMKRKISKRDFIEAFRKKQTKLIRLEAQIDEKFNKEKLSVEAGPMVKEIATKKKHIVEELLGEKKMTLKEMKIAQKMYLKRKIDAPTYQKLINERQQRLIELEAQLKQIYGEESVSQVMKDLKNRLTAVEKQRQEQQKKKKLAKDRTESEIAEQIAEQVRGFR